ncbi:MAG: DUF6950 family protein [Litorimonas sp.]
MARVITPARVFGVARSHLSEPFEWRAGRDCTAACVVFEALHGVDPLARFDQAYTSSVEACLILKRAGGYLAWCRSIFDIEETETPQAGDLVLIQSSGPLGAALSICIQSGEYAAKTETGMIIVRSKVLGAWRCPS